MSSLIQRRRFGKQVQYYMRLHKVKYRDITKALGVSNESVRRWRMGEVYPTVTKLIDLAEVLRCTANDLLYAPEPTKRERTMEEILAYDRQVKAAMSNAKPGSPPHN